MNCVLKRKTFEEAELEPQKLDFDVLHRTQDELLKKYETKEDIIGITQLKTIPNRTVIHYKHSLYEGEVQDKQKHGFGKYKNKEGTTITGQFQQDQMHGKIQIDFFDGSSFKGSANHGVFQGFGEFKS